MRRLIAHALGWHTPACHGDARCWRPGSVDIRPFGWHRFLADRGRRRR